MLSRTCLVLVGSGAQCVCSQWSKVGVDGAKSKEWVHCTTEGNPLCIRGPGTEADRIPCRCSAIARDAYSARMQLAVSSSDETQMSCQSYVPPDDLAPNNLSAATQTAERS